MEAEVAVVEATEVHPEVEVEFVTPTRKASAPEAVHADLPTKRH